MLTIFCILLGFISSSFIGVFGGFIAQSTSVAAADASQSDGLTDAAATVSAIISLVSWPITSTCLYLFIKMLFGRKKNKHEKGVAAKGFDPPPGWRGSEPMPLKLPSKPNN